MPRTEAIQEQLRVGVRSSSRMASLGMLMLLAAGCAFSVALTSSDDNELTIELGRLPRPFIGRGQHFDSGGLGDGPYR